MLRALRLATCLLALPLAACDGESKSGAGGPSPTSPPPASPGPEAPITVTHILIGFKDRETKQERTPEEALAIAKSVMADLAAGRSMEALVRSFTDDRDAKGEPNADDPSRPGTYRIPGPKLPRAVPEFMKAARETPVGKVAPEPVKTDYGYHVIRRDK
jgi:parvulin-like peptidyl-prolyl isomerase